MENRAWVVPITLIIIGVPIAAMIVYLVKEQLKALSNRIYKSAREHQILNASDRSAWAAGRLPGTNEEKELSRLTTLVLPIGQLATVIALAVAVTLWNAALIDDNAKLNERVSELELQLHALALTSGADARLPVRIEGDPPGAPPGTSPAAPVNPMQQACANLIGRVADAYEKGESSKIAQSLEDLVKKLGCENGAPPP